MSKVTGVQEFVTALRLLDQQTQRRVRAAVSESTADVAEEARRRVPVSGPESRKAKNRPGPGELRDTIRAEMMVEGFTGFAKAGFGKLVRRSRATRAKKLGPLTRKAFAREQQRLALKASREQGVYAMVVEYGSPGRGTAPRPYMRPAAQAVRPRHQQRLRDALVEAVEDAAAGRSAGGDGSAGGSDE